MTLKLVQRSGKKLICMHFFSLIITAFLLNSCSDSTVNKEADKTLNPPTETATSPILPCCEVIFPYLKLKRDDFVKYYEKTTGNDAAKFKNLVFQFQYKKNAGKPDSVYLIGYALNKLRGTLNTDIIPFTVDSRFKTFSNSFNFGNLQLSNGDLEELIGKPSQIILFEYLLFVPEQIVNGYIRYTVSVDENMPLLSKYANPCPPAPIE
jgi:hypothetical protein